MSNHGRAWSFRYGCFTSVEISWSHDLIRIRRHNGWYVAIIGIGFTDMEGVVSSVLPHKSRWFVSEEWKETGVLYRCRVWRYAAAVVGDDAVIVGVITARWSSFYNNYWLYHDFGNQSVFLLK